MAYSFGFCKDLSLSEPLCLLSSMFYRYTTRGRGGGANSVVMQLTVRQLANGNAMDGAWRLDPSAVARRPAPVRSGLGTG